MLDKRTTSTGDTGMNLVLRQGALKDGEGYTFTLHITDLTTGEEGFASIDLLPNQPPVGGSCRLFPRGPLRALMAKVHFECTGECAGHLPALSVLCGQMFLLLSKLPAALILTEVVFSLPPAPGHCWSGLSSEVDLNVSVP